MSLKDVKNILNKYDRFLVTSHKRPEGDAIGSIMAIALLLKKLDKEAVIITEDPVPKNLDFIEFCEVKLAKEVKHFNCDANIVLDATGLDRIGGVAALLNSKPVINIDHHVSNAKFGDVNWIDVKASSTSQMIFHLFGDMNITLDRDTALCIYVGILTDTGSFRFSNTTANAMETCSKLLRYKIQPELVSNLIYNRRSFTYMRLLGRALTNLKSIEGGEVAWLKITRQMLDETGAKIKECDNFIEFIRMIEPVKVAIVFYSLGDRIKVSFRSKGEVDVNKIASFFGGGGHELASGVEIDGSIEEVERKVLKKVKEELEALAKK